MIQKIDSNKFSLTILKVTTFSRIRQGIAVYSLQGELLKFGKTDKKMRKYLGKTDKLSYICHGKADKIRPFNNRKGDKVSYT